MLVLHVLCECLWGILYVLVEPTEEFLVVYQHDVVGVLCMYLLVCMHVTLCAVQ